MAEASLLEAAPWTSSSSGSDFAGSIPSFPRLEAMGNIQLPESRQKFVELLRNFLPGDPERFAWMQGVMSANMQDLASFEWRDRDADLNAGVLYHFLNSTDPYSLQTETGLSFNPSNDFASDYHTLRARILHSAFGSPDTVSNLIRKYPQLESAVLEFLYSSAESNLPYNSFDVTAIASADYMTVGRNLRAWFYKNFVINQNE